MDEDSHAKFFDKISDKYQFGSDVLRCLHNYLLVQSWPADHVFVPHERGDIAFEEVERLKIAVYAAWKTDDDDGRQLFRTGENRRTNIRDAQWCIVCSVLVIFPGFRTH